MNEVELAAALYEKYPMMGMTIAIEIAALAVSFLDRDNDPERADR